MSSLVLSLISNRRVDTLIDIVYIGGILWGLVLVQHPALRRPDSILIRHAPEGCDPWPLSERLAISRGRWHPRTGVDRPPLTLDRYVTVCLTLLSLHASYCKSPFRGREGFVAVPRKVATVPVGRRMGISPSCNKVGLSTSILYQGKDFHISVWL